jgi:hypothetical protein
MTDHTNGPPKEVEAGAPHHRDNRTSTNRRSNPQRQNTGAGDKTSGNALVWLPCTRSYPQDLPTQLARRREAARRLPRFL